jgi:heme/copper-type cytochrome/quinol oxidase subunit 3
MPGSVRNELLALPAAGASGTGGEGRRLSLPLAAAVSGVAVAALMGGLIGAYLALKAAPGPFLPDNVEFDNYTAATLTITVLLTMVMIEWANYGIRKGFRGQALFGFGVAAGLQVAFLNGLYYLISQKLGFEVADGPYQTVVHALLVVPFLLVAGSLLATVLTWLRAIGHQLTLDNLHVGRAAAIVVHIAGLAWVAAHYTVYVTK